MKREAIRILLLTQTKIGKDILVIEGRLLGIVFLLGNLISWKSKKHNVVARSNAKAKYRDNYFKS